MRIAVLCTDQGVRVPGGKGASLHLLAVTRAFARLGHEVLLLGVAGHGAPPAGVQTWLLPHPGRAEGVVRERNKLALTERFVVEAAPVLRRFEPDLLYERLSLFGTAGLRLAAATGARHVVEVNALLAEEEATWRGLTLVQEARRREHAVLTGADHVVCVSDEWTARIRRWRSHGVTTVPNGFDEKLFGRPLDRGRIRRALGLPLDLPIAVFAGTVRPWHGLEHAVRALDHLPALHLAVAGEGPDLPVALDIAAELGVSSRTHALGHLPQSRVADLLRVVDIGLAPYPPLADFAFSPLKVWEYLAAGLPWVGSDLGQLRTLAGSVGSGRVVTPGHELELAEAIAETLCDPTARPRAAAAQQLAVERFGWTARAQEILTTALAAPARSTP